MSNKLKAAVYCRTNTPDRADIESQKEIAMQIVKEQELQIFDIYTDVGYSGLNYERPGLQKMMADIENGEIDCVIVSTYSRIGRGYSSSFEIALRIEKSGAFLIIADEIQNPTQGWLSLC